MKRARPGRRWGPCPGSPLCSLTHARAMNPSGGREPAGRTEQWLCARPSRGACGQDRIIKFHPFLYQGSQRRPEFFRNFCQEFLLKSNLSSFLKRGRLTLGVLAMEIKIPKGPAALKLLRAQWELATYPPPPHPPTTHTPASSGLQKFPAMFRKPPWGKETTRVSENYSPRFISHL